jgi:hypothetical protein
MLAYWRWLMVKQVRSGASPYWMPALHAAKLRNAVRVPRDVKPTQEIHPLSGDVFRVRISWHFASLVRLTHIG